MSRCSNILPEDISLNDKKDMKINDFCFVRTIHLDRIKQAEKESVPENYLLGLVSIFKGMGDPTRLKIITALLGGEMCVCDLAAYLNLTESAVSHQLRNLRELNLIKKRRQGQILFYSLDDDHLADLIKKGLELVREMRTT
jgi:ArsR family transcriptional regulator, lead/cadmium/zinc/bismuth-responsive transcriptional repressor